MKSLTLYTIFLLFLSHTIIQAQKIVPLSFSPKIGVNFNDFIISESSTPTLSLAKLGWNVGMDVNYGNRVQSKAGLHFFKLGTGIEMVKDTGNVTERVSTSQFKIPVGVSYKVWNVEYFNLWVQGQIVMNLTTKMVRTRGETESDIYPRNGIGGRLGVGMDLGRFIFEVNYERSFTAILGQTFDAQSKLINMSLGLKI